MCIGSIRELCQTEIRQIGGGNVYLGTCKDMFNKVLELYNKSSLEVKIILVGFAAVCAIAFFLEKGGVGMGKEDVQKAAAELKGDGDRGSRASVRTGRRWSI